MESYSIYFGEGVIAKELTLTNCLIMLEALYKTYSKQDGLALTVVRTLTEEPEPVQPEAAEKEKEV